MMTSWHETEQIEAGLLGTAGTADRLLFEARLLLDEELADKTLWQQRTYKLVQQYGRMQLKNEVEEAHKQLFNSSRHHGFAHKIRSLFSKK
jgi:hypothetical protein